MACDSSPLQELGVKSWPTWGCEKSKFPWSYRCVGRGGQHLVKQCLLAALPGPERCLILPLGPSPRTCSRPQRGGDGVRAAGPGNRYS